MIERLIGGHIMKTIVTHCKKRTLSSAMAMLLLPAIGFASSEVSPFTGLWKTTQYGNFEQLELCVTDSSISYSRVRDSSFEEDYLTEIENIDLVEDVVLISFYQRGALMRKLIMVHRSDRHELVGQLHLYDGFRNFNYIPVYLKKTADTCEE